VLLYKAEAATPKDNADFDACLPRIDAEGRSWLARALRTVHPGHAWNHRLP